MTKKYYKQNHMKWASTCGSSKMSYRPRNKETTQEVEGTIHDNGSTSTRTVLPLEYWASSTLRKSEASRPVPGRLVPTERLGGSRVPGGRASV